jgi:hypothetical protein
MGIPSILGGIEDDDVVLTVSLIHWRRLICPQAQSQRDDCGAGGGGGGDEGGGSFEENSAAAVKLKTQLIK